MGVSKNENVISLKEFEKNYNFGDSIEVISE